MAALHITVGYKGSVPQVLYIGSDATAANLAYENDTECDRYQLLKHCAGLRKGPKAAPAPVAQPAPAPVQETETEPEESTADESETASAPRRGRPPKNKE